MLQLPFSRSITSTIAVLTLVLTSLAPESVTVTAWPILPRPAIGGSGIGAKDYLPPHRVWSTSPEFKALPPMPNPNRKILLSQPGFQGPDTDSSPSPSPGGGGGGGPGGGNDTVPTPGGGRRLPAITRVDKDNNMFYDEYGRVRVFRGMAVSYKVAPYHPELDKYDPIFSFNEDDMRLFDKLNLNIIRLGISWAAVQPQKGPDGFDMEYLAKIKRLVEKSEAAGLYVLIECHQDLFAEKFLGDGAPAWAITKDWSTLPFPMPIHGFTRAQYDPALGPEAAPVNMNYTDFWGTEYGSDAVVRAFWGLYTNYDGVQDEFIRFWGKLAEVFSGMSNVIGYEIINEPFIAARSTLHVPLSWLQRSNTDAYYLQPMYNRVEAAIREHDDTALIFWEPVCGSGGDLGDGFTQTPGNRPEKSVFSFHSYGPNAIDTLTMEEAINKGVYQAKRLGGAAMMTEWDVEYVQGQRRLRRVLEMADLNRLSWIGWQYKQYVRVAGSPPHGTLIDPHTGVYRPGMCRLFSRPYPTAVTGDLHSFLFNWNTSLLTVDVSPPTSSEAEIVISVTEEDEWGWDGAWTVLSVTTESGERIGTVRVEKEEDLDVGQSTGVRWWVERAWVEGSKLVKVRLGKDWVGKARVTVGMVGSTHILEDDSDGPLPGNGDGTAATVTRSALARLISGGVGAEFQ